MPAGQLVRRRGPSRLPSRRRGRTSRRPTTSQATLSGSKGSMSSSSTVATSITGSATSHPPSPHPRRRRSSCPSSAHRILAACTRLAVDASMMRPTPAAGATALSPSPTAQSAVRMATAAVGAPRASLGATLAIARHAPSFATGSPTSRRVSTLSAAKRLPRSSTTREYRSTLIARRSTRRTHARPPTLASIATSRLPAARASA
mmetsp:Transcript_62884/g.124208  ORF Transcript_62884/g.124208 Transcript_62884/m.124208 type:complete len:204 (+) Transcript_62884:690-1301(+)